MMVMESCHFKVDDELKLTDLLSSLIYQPPIDLELEMALAYYTLKLEVYSRWKSLRTVFLALSVLSYLLSLVWFHNPINYVQRFKQKV